MQIKKFLAVFEVNVLDITPEITRRAMEYVESYALSDSMRLADALIAATAVENGKVLCTANGKHYKCIADLQMHVFRVV
ncbi:MAG: PIN domain-containing protein [Treponema sp.]|nr:PIN domain-containing protein [Treponema sp.]